MMFNSNNKDGNGSGLRVDERPCVLVVDDNEAVAHALAKILTHEGWRVTLCYNGVDALKQVECETALVEAAGAIRAEIADHRVEWGHVDGESSITESCGGDVFHQQAV